MVDATVASSSIGCSSRSSQPGGTSVSEFRTTALPLVRDIAALTVAMNPRLTGEPMSRTFARSAALASRCATAGSVLPSSASRMR